MLNGSNLCLLGLLCMLQSAVPSFAASVLSMNPAGNGTFVLQGSGLMDTAIIDVEISYESSSFVNPRVTQGTLITGAMTAANVDVPGIVRLSVMPPAPIMGNGTIATISFQRTGDAPGRISALTGRITNAAGKSLPVSFNVQNPPDYSSGASNPDRSQTTPQVVELFLATPPPPQVASEGGTPYPFVVGGSLTFPNVEMAANEQKPAIMQENRPTTREEQEVPPPPPVEAPKSDLPKTDLLKGAAEINSPEISQSVLEKFRLFQGQRTVAALVELFKSAQTTGFKQEPPIVISDGKKSVKVSISKMAGSHAPNFAFTAARAVSLDVSGDVWGVEVKPSSGAIKASVIVLTDGVLHEFPLAVSPLADVDVNRSGRVTEDDFLLFLKERGSVAVPKFDLNGDGRRDYLDDYIFTANYLARSQYMENVTAAGNASKDRK